MDLIRYSARASISGSDGRSCRVPSSSSSRIDGLALGGATGAEVSWLGSISG